METSRSEVCDIDPFGQAFRTDPQSYYPRMLGASPAWIIAEGTPSILIATYAQTAAVVRDFKTFSSVKPARLPGMQKFDFFNGLPVMNYADPPDHTRRRRVASPAFGPKRVEALVEQIRPVIGDLLDRAAASGTFDAVADVTRPMAIDALLTRFLNIDEADQSIFLTFSSTFALLDKLGPDDPKPPAYMAAWAQGVAHCRRETERARVEKKDSLIGLIAATVEGGVLSDDEMMAMMVVLMAGGLSTVSAAASLSLYHLARNPQVAERIRQDPSLAARHFEETLRVDSPVQFLMRFATVDTVLEGTPIPQGTPVYAMISAACHDPAVFPDPGEFDIDRPNGKEHLAFGQGIHTCIGNTITRVLVPLLIQEAAARMPNLRVADTGGAVVFDNRTARARLPASISLMA